MTLIVEDGTIVTGANTFISQADFRSYCDDRGINLDAYDPLLIDASIVRAGDWLNNEDRLWWRGQRVNDEQSMAWPRAGVIVQLGTGNELPSNLIPSKIKQAQCYLTFKQLTVGDVQPDLDRGGGIQSVSAGGVSVTYMSTAMIETLYQAAQGILKPYLRRVYYTIQPTFIEDDRGYDKVSNVDVTDGISDRPGVDDTEEIV